MDPTVITYLSSLAISLALIAWVGSVETRYGSVVLTTVYHGDTALAGAISKLMAIGFYLLTLGYVAFTLNISGPIDDAAVGIRAGGREVGGVLLVLGILHFLILSAGNRLRRTSVPSVVTHRSVVPHQ
jgi:hypothetical protein